MIPTRLRGLLQILASGTALSLLVGSAVAADGRLNAARATYQKSLGDIAKKYQERIQAWPSEYTNQLRSLQGKLQKAGDLENWAAVKKELDRFANNARITDADLAAEPADLRTLQVSFKDAASQLPSQKDREIVALYKKYYAHLESLKKELTVGGKFEDAVAVSEEMKRVQSSQEVTAAEFSVAAQDAARPQKPATPDSPDETPADGPAAPADAKDPTVYPLTTVDGAKVHGPGRRAGPLGDLAFKRMSLTDTEHSPLARGFRAAMWIGNQANTQYVRLSLNTSDTGLSAENVKVVVEVYTKTQTHGPKKVDPMVFEVQHVALPRVTSQANFVDCRPANIPSYMDLYGVIVSVFSAGGKLEFQGVFPPAVKPMAKPEIQQPRSSSFFFPNRRP